MAVATPKRVYTGHCLVRDKNGNPKFDDINNIPQGFWDLLTLNEQTDIKAQRALKKGK